MLTVCYILPTPGPNENPTHSLLFYEENVKNRAKERDRYMGRGKYEGRRRRRYVCTMYIRMYILLPVRLHFTCGILGHI